jgi:GNAT superfamily N-acetyltransferase
MLATRTYLEMTSPDALRPWRVADDDLDISHCPDCSIGLFRALYADVGREYRWVDRLAWTDDEVRAYLADPAVTIWLLTVSGTRAGYFELRRDADGGVEIAYFGLLPGFTGRRLGAHLLTEAVARAWSMGARRVWLHTCTFDHPAALPNYLKRGFTVFKTEQYQVA